MLPASASTISDHAAIAKAMRAAFAGVGLAARTFVMAVDPHGVDVTVSEA